ncbi:ABC transporter permease [Vallitalea okinawensis]|uniref:ABC transporter permease n=1 Tax=Vallitalea okinawensis TaxID=2078660 RepID=UPI000CFB6416|nr:ABC transporter permease [Vallitalea okinawensis]
MNTFLPTVKNECMKLFARKRTKVFILILALLTVLLVVLQYTANSFLGFNIIQSDQLAKTIIELMFMFIVPLFTFILGVDSFASEKSQGTLKILLTSPVSRIKLYFSKLVALTIANLLMVFSILIVAIIGSAFSASDAFFSGTIEAFITCILVIIPLGLISAWGLLIGQLFSNGSMAIGLGVLGLFLINVGQVFIDKLYVLSPLTYMDFYSPLMNSSIGINFFMILLYMVAYYIILVSAGLLRLTTAES